MNESQGHGAGKCDNCHEHDTCGGMCWHHHGRHIIIRILVALFIFWCGVQFGELKSSIRGEFNQQGYGYPMMGWTTRAYPGAYGPNMMYTVSQEAVAPQAQAPAKTTTTTTAK